jgi:hypothetical protein
MGTALAVLGLAVGLAVAVRGGPLVVEAIAGRRLEAAARSGDGVGLLRVVGGEGRSGELGRVLRRLPMRELVALGDGLVAVAGEERGARVLAAIAAVVEERNAVMERWAAARERQARWGEGGEARLTGEADGRRVEGR